MKIEVSLTPDLYSHRTLRRGHATVAIDVLRASTAVCAAFSAGCEAVLPLDQLADIDQYRQQGYSVAAERGGRKVGNAEYGNSPTEYLRHDMHGVRLAYSTTNGTVSMLRGADADVLMVGCLANLSRLCQGIRALGKDVVLLCSGWEGDYCNEDVLVAGAILDRLSDVATPVGDAAHMATYLWNLSARNLMGFCMLNCSHVERLVRLGAVADVQFALRVDTCPVLPVLKDGILVVE